nr:tropomyosin [Calothrix elsteri]
MSLQDFYFDCLAFCPNGKKIFSEWLASPDFGASRYIAQSAMEISDWFDKLPAKVQHLVRQNVQQWSVSALRQLTKVSHDLVKELVRSGKKTAAQVKKEFGSARAKEGENLVGSHLSETVNDMSTSLSLSLSRSQTPISDSSQEGESEKVGKEGKKNNISPLLPAPELVPGMRIVVKEENTGWNGSSGIIMSKQEGNFWVLLDHTIAQGMEVKHLLKPHQIGLETQQPIAKSTSQELFTAAQVEQKVASAIAQYNSEKAESEQGRFVEIRDAALQAAKREIQAAQEYARAIALQNQDLLEQLAGKDEEVRSLHALQTRNQQLEQRVAELEKALENSSANNWGNTFNNQAAKVVNSELEKTIEPLMSEVERLQNLMRSALRSSASLSQEQELSQLQILNRKQQEESSSDAVLAEFGEIGERFGWSGWSRRGYRAASGMLCTGIGAIAAFISDLKSSSPSYQQQEITF